MTKPKTRLDEDFWNEGWRAGWLNILRQAIEALGYDDMRTQKRAWILEREAVIAALREVCRDHGDNDWSNGLHLADVIQKHLARHL